MRRIFTKNKSIAFVLIVVCNIFFTKSVAIKEKPELKIAQSNEPFSAPQLIAPSSFTTQTLELTPTDEIEGNFSKVLPNASLNFTLSVTGFFEELKNLILGTETEAFYPKTIEEIQFYKKEILGNSKPENDLSDMMPGGCPDVEFIDLRNVPGYPQIDDLNACGSADTLSMIIFTGDPGEIKGFEFEIDFPDGIEYAGWAYAQLGNTSINATDPDVNRPTFLVDGITGDSLVIVNIGVRTTCEVDKEEMLFFDYNFDYTFIDTSNVVHNCSGSFTPSEEFNASVHISVLNMLSPLSPVDATITSLGAPGCQTIKLSQDGLSSYLDSFMFEIIGLETFGGELVLDSIRVNDMVVPSGDIEYDAGTMTTALNVDGTYFPANALNNPADNRMNTNEVVEIEVCYSVNNCPTATDIPFNYSAKWGCDDMICEQTTQTSFIKIRPTGTLPATATATLNAAGIEICGNPGEVSITLNNPNSDTEQNAYKDVKIGFQTCNKPNLDVTNVVVGGVIIPSSYYTWVGDDINIDFTGNTDATLGLEDYDNDGFYDDMSGSTSISAVVEISVDCGVNSGECNPMECNDIQFYVDYKTNCGTQYKEFPDPNTFDLFYSADTVYNDSEVALNSAMTVFGHNFGKVSNDGDPIAGTGPDTVAVEFCYEFSVQNISECPSGPTDYLYVDFIGSPSTILDVQFVSGSGMVSTDGGATYVAAASESWSKSSDTDAQLILEQASTSNNVCFKYSMEMDSCLCAPVQYFLGNQKVVSVCDDCAPDCEIVKACRTTTFAVDQDCTGCPCIIDHGIVKSERKNLGYTNKTMTTKHTRESLTDAGRAVDLGRFVPGDTLQHEEFFVILDEGVLNNVSYWAMIWYWYPIGLGQTGMARLPLVPDFSAGRILEYAVSKDGTGAKTDIDLASLSSCTNTNSSPYYGMRNYWNDNPWGFPKHFGSLNSAPDYWDNQFTYIHLFNYEKVDECGGSEGIRADGNCLDDMITAHNIEVGDTIWLSFDVPLIKNPQREALKAFGQEPDLQNNARMVTQFNVYEMNEISGNSTYCASYYGQACREELPLFLDCPGDIQARTEMDLTDCGGQVTHEFWVADLPGELGDPWFTEEYRPLAEIFDVDALIRAPLAYCANGQAEHLGVIYPLTSDSAWNMFCSPVVGFSDEICAVETGDSARIVFNLSDLGIPALGYGDGNCDTIKLTYDLCMVCPSDIDDVLNYDLRYDWRYAGGHNYSELDDYLCNQIHATNPDPYLENSICDELGGTGNGANWFELMMFYDTLMGSNDVISETFILNDMRDPLTPISVTNHSPNLIASDAPGVSIEIQEIEICNSDIDDDATGVGMSVTIPSSIRLADVYTDAAGTMALVKELISDDGIDKKYKITLPTDIYTPNECHTFYVGTTLLFCPDPSDAPPKICAGAFSGCAADDVKAALAASGGCGGSEVCYTYIFGEVGIQTEWFDLPETFALCDTVTMNVLVKNTKELVLLNLAPMFDLPPGIAVVPGSWEVAYPGGPTTLGTWTNIPTDPDVVVGNTYSYSDDGLWNDWINNNGLQGVSAANTTADSNKVSFRFRVYSNCDEFLSGSKALTETTAANPCSDEMISSGLSQSPPLIIQEADPDDFAQLLLVSNPEIINCEGTVNTFGITAINSGTESTSDSVLVCVTFPEGLDYQTGTVMYTSPGGFPVGTVTETPIGTAMEVCFSGPKIGAYGSMTMSFDAAMDPDQVCGDVYLLADIKSFVDSVTCTPGPPAKCGVFVQNSLNNRVNVELAPPFVAEDIEVFTSCPSAGSNIELSYEFTINHNGPNASNQPYTVNFYEDVDGSLDVNPNVDNLLGSESGVFSVNDGATIMLNGVIDVADGQSCPVLFEVVYDTDCACDRTEEYLDNIKLEALKEYDEPITMCPGSCIDIEVCDFVSVVGDSIRGSTGIPYVLDIDWAGLNVYTLPRPSGTNLDSITYTSMTDNSEGGAGYGNILVAEQSGSYGQGYLVASYPYPVSVERVYLGAGSVFGWGATIGAYTSTPYCLEYSNDGLTWTDSGVNMTGATNGSVEENILPTPIGAQYWRLSSCGAANRNWATSEFRLEGDPVDFMAAAPISQTGSTVTICIPDGVGIDMPWEIDFMTGTGDCEVTETLEIWGIDSPGITIEGDTVACDGQCVDLEIIVPNDATAGMTVSWTPAALIDDPTAFRIDGCNLTGNTTFQATISYNDGACVEVLDWPVEFFPSNTIDVEGEELDCYNMVEPPVLTADAGWDVYNWYQLLSGGEFIAYSNSENTFVPTPGATYYVQATRAGTLCPAVSSSFSIPNNTCLIDLGDLPDTGAGTSNVNYETLLENNGPYHIIIDGLHLGPNVDEELDGQPSSDALGDGTDENATDFPGHLDIKPNSTFRLPLSVVNTTGETAHLEAWIDWNGDGEFTGLNEMILDIDDSASLGVFPTDFTVTVPSDAAINTILGVRFRLSNTDDMTPYGLAEAGEIEDYLIQLDCDPNTCLPVNVIISNGGN